MQNNEIMTFDDITEDGRLLAVRYDEEKEYALYTLFDQWYEAMWLHDGIGEAVPS